MFNRDHIIYLAGIIDGEGSLSIEIQNPNTKGRKTDYYAIRLVVINTHKPLIDWIHEHFAGIIHTRPPRPKQKQCYNWIIHSFKAAAILKECEPFMIVKKRQANIIMEFMKTKQEGSWNITTEVQQKRRELYQEMKSLNKQGV